MQEDITKQLKSLQSIEPDKAWQTAERGKLMERAAVFSVDDVFTVREIGEEKARFGLKNLFFPSRLGMAAASFALAVTAGAAAVNAAQSSLPGEKLYAVKKASEKVALAVASDEDKPKIEIEQAGKRLEELAKIGKQAQNEEDKAKVEALVAEFQEKVDSANTHLEKLSQKGKTDTNVKVAGVAKIINEQSEKYTQVLQATSQTLPEAVKGRVAVKVADATVTAQKTNLRALLVMVESPEEKPIPQEEIAAKVQTAVEQTQAKIEVMAQQTAAESAPCGAAVENPAAEAIIAKEEPDKGTCSISASTTDALKAEEAKKELEKAKENLKNNNLADTLKNVVAATEIASGVSMVKAAEPAEMPEAAPENAEGQSAGEPKEAQTAR